MADPLRSEHDAGRLPIVITRAAQATVRVVAGGNHVTSLLTGVAGDSVWVPPDEWHGTVNASDRPVRFLVVGVPGVMTDYFAQAGVVVPDDETAPATGPPGPAQLAELAARFGIAFFDGDAAHRP